MRASKLQFYIAECAELFRFYLPKCFPATTRIKYLQYLSRKYVEPRLAVADFPPKISLETRTKCNGHCPFCAASVESETRPDTVMPEELFKKVVSELAARDYRGLLTFSGNNEPLLDKRIAEWIGYARQNLPAARLGLMTNGVLLTSKLGRQLFEAGLDRLQIDNYSTNGVLLKNVTAFMANVKPLFPDRDIKLFNRRYQSKMVTNRAGSNPQGIAQVNLPLPCKYLFDQFNITTSGEVCMCCQDIFCSGKLGNVTSDSVAAVWRSERYQGFRKKILCYDRASVPLCSGCDFMGFGPGDVSFPHNVLLRFKLI